MCNIGGNNHADVSTLSRLNPTLHQWLDGNLIPKKNLQRRSTASDGNKYVKMLIVNDYERYQQWGMDTLNSSFAVFNIMAGIYSNYDLTTFGGGSHGKLIPQIIGIFVTTSSGLFLPSSTTNVDAGSLLSDFCTWR